MIFVVVVALACEFAIVIVNGLIRFFKLAFGRDFAKSMHSILRKS